jgi:hypothetical protein
MSKALSSHSQMQRLLYRKTIKGQNLNRNQEREWTPRDVEKALFIYGEYEGKVPNTQSALNWQKTRDENYATSTIHRQVVSSIDCLNLT